MASLGGLSCLSRNLRRSISLRSSGDVHHRVSQATTRFAVGLAASRRRHNWNCSSAVCVFSSSSSAAAASSLAASSAQTENQCNNGNRNGAAMALEQVLTPAFLQSIRDFWFEHLASDDDLVLPGMAAHARWYGGGPEFDKACLTQFEPALAAIQASGVKSGAELLRLIGTPKEPCDWLSLILLLDQMPRNCYRGPSSRVAFTVFDPLALGVAQAAVAAGVPHTAPEIRWQLAYRTWFYLPFMHSEDASVHEESRRVQYKGLAEDVKMLREEEGEGDDDEYRRRAWRVVHRDEQAAQEFVDRLLDFQKRHEDIIQKFGRYPHRNGPLGRVDTAAEREFLEGGGDTFSK